MNLYTRLITAQTQHFKDQLERINANMHIIIRAEQIARKLADHGFAIYLEADDKLQPVIRLSATEAEAVNTCNDLIEPKADWSFVISPVPGGAAGEYLIVPITDRMTYDNVRLVVTTQVCTCPSGDGSLRWPCQIHPPKQASMALAAAATNWDVPQ